MGIHDRIEEIRRKPEHIRMRYVIVLVVISTIFVIGIWVVSLKAGRQEKSQPIPFDSQQIFNGLEEQKNSIQGVENGLKRSFPDESVPQNDNEEE